MPTGRLTIIDRASELPLAWERVARAGTLAFDPRFLSAFQSQIVDGGTRRYCLYESETGATTIATATLIEPAAARNPVASVLLGRWYGRLPTLLDGVLPMLVLRSDTSGEVPYYCTDATQAEREATLCGFLVALEHHAARERWSLALDGVPDDDPAMSAACAQRGYLRTLARPCAHMRIEWSSWTDYLKAAARHSKRAVTNIRTELNRARRDGLAIAEWSPAETPESGLYRLLVDHEMRLNGRASLFKPGVFAHLAETLQGDFRVLLGTCSGRLQGVVVFARSGNRGYLTHPGLLHENERAASLYFNLMYYHPIRMAIELGLESLAFGNGVLAAKVRRGCFVTAGALYVWPRTRTMRLSLGAPIALHRHSLQRKYARVLRAAPFSNLAPSVHARPAD